MVFSPIILILIFNLILNFILFLNFVVNFSVGVNLKSNTCFSVYGTGSHASVHRSLPPPAAMSPTHVEADAVVKMSLPSLQDGRTDSTR